jgi:hypothetical protein
MRRRSVNSRRRADSNRAACDGHGRTRTARTGDAALTKRRHCVSPAGDEIVQPIVCVGGVRSTVPGECDRRPTCRRWHAEDASRCECDAPSRAPAPCRDPGRSSDPIQDGSWILRAFSGSRSASKSIEPLRANAPQRTPRELVNRSGFPGAVHVRPALVRAGLVLGDVALVPALL